MEFERLTIPDVVLVKPKVLGDVRGWFFESWEARKFASAGLDAAFVQDNYSCSVQGTLRGLHYQILKPQGKLVRVTAGEVFDVAVDIRRSSPSFGKWVGTILSGDNKHQLWVPPGFAHGFYVLSESAEFFYKCSDFYAPEHERTLRWDDPSLGIVWPLEGRVPLLSAKDQHGKALADADCFP
ncbi:MAG TPA: dTDP-4-dehydrorhamnose 3,5-epimerase [Gammaproteobacteria bacterium]|nr:dTDP-4-dehydrorhamnose 3,5-epimerase [Gammaproteobacteria bacterium]